MPRTELESAERVPVGGVAVVVLVEGVATMPIARTLDKGGAGIVEAKGSRDND